MTLEDPFEQPPVNAEERMLIKLQQTFALRVGGGGVLVALAATAIVVACIVVTLVLSVLSWFWFDAFYIWLWFLLYVGVVGYLLWREHKRSQSTFDEVRATGQPPIDFDVDEYLESPSESSKLGSYLNAIFWAPRNLLEGINIMRRKESPRFFGLLHRAARMMVILYADKDPVEVKKLIEPGESPSRFREALDWLDENDDIGRSSDGKRVWMSSKMRTKIATEGL
jgi:hypothetical protein